MSTTMPASGPAGPPTPDSEIIGRRVRFTFGDRPLVGTVVEVESYMRFNEPHRRLLTVDVDVGGESRAYTVLERNSEYIHD